MSFKLPPRILAKEYSLTQFDETYKLRLDGFNYHDGGAPCIKVIDTFDGGPFATLTVNIPALSNILADGEFFVKTWHENGPISKALLDSGDFVHTGKVVTAGYEQAQIWRLSDG